jgi:hypothetical protein
MRARNGLVWGFPVKRLLLGFADSSSFGAGTAVLRRVACDPVPGARGRGQGTETLAQLGSLPPFLAVLREGLVARISRWRREVDGIGGRARS